MLRTGKEFVKIGLRRNIKTELRVCYGCVKVSVGQSQGRSGGQRRSDRDTVARPAQSQGLYGRGEPEASWKQAEKLRARASWEQANWEQTTSKEEATMTNYTLMFIGDYTNAEAAVKAWDKAFRRFYHVYGGCRIESGKTITGQFFVTMKYTARWANYPHAMKGRFQRVCDAAIQMLNRHGFDWDTLMVQEVKE